MESGEIPSSALKSSSDYNQYFGAERSRLNENQDGSYYGGWASKHADVGQWLQIDLGKVTKVTRIATQGRYDANWWVTKYTLSYSSGGPFKFYKNGEVSVQEKTIAVIDATFAVAKTKPEKKFRLVWDSYPRPLRYRCSALTNKPTWSWSSGQLVINL